MKLVLDLPAWADERHIYVLAGIELIAYKEAGKDRVVVKSVRCDQCGKCCENLSLAWPFSDGKGGCVYLVKEPGKDEKKSCSLGPRRPLCCSVGDPVMFKRAGAEEWCCVRFEGVE